MKLSEKLLIVANWLEDSDNDLLVNAENDDKNLEIVATSLVKAANILKQSAEEIQHSEPQEDILDEVAKMADAFDKSDDEYLQKQASVLDELLLTIAAPRNSVINFRETIDDRIEELKKKYKDTKQWQDEMNKVSDSIKDIEKSPTYKKYRILQAPLSSRYCPDHGGVSTIRIGEHTVQCPLDKKIYNYTQGYTLLNGDQVPGGDVSEQTNFAAQPQAHTVFDSRSSRLNLPDEK